MKKNVGIVIAVFVVFFIGLVIFGYNATKNSKKDVLPSPTPTIVIEEGDSPEVTDASK